MKLLKKITALIILLNMLITLNSPIISYAADQGTDGETGEQTEEIGTDYEIKEEETWDISKNGDGSVIAKWTLEDRTITISGNGEMKDWTYNSNEDWHNIKYTNLIENVKIGESVTSIGRYAFEGCSSLTSIKLPSNIISIGQDAFGGCSSLTNIEIPNSVTSIESYAFEGCSSLTSIKLPSNIISIGQNAFGECRSLTNIEIPNSVTKIGYSTFYNCSSLENIYVEENNSKYISMEGVLYNKEKTDLICYPEGKKDTNFIVPDSVATIEDNAFSGCSSLTSIEIPNSVTSIGSSVFCGCSSLTNIEIPNGITSIEYYAFRGCSSLTSIAIPNSTTSIGEYAFGECRSLTNIEIPNGVTSIGNNAFRGCSSLTNIEIPNGITSIGNNAFCGCSSLTNIEIPNGITSIEYYAFSGCSSLTNIEIPNSVTSIGGYAFGECRSLTNIEIPNSVTSIGSYAFYRCSRLTSIRIPNSATSIEECAFYGCSSLTNIEIPNSVISIEECAFLECSSLRNIKIPNSVTSIEKHAFYKIKGPIICNTNSKAQEYCENDKQPYILLDNNTSNITTDYEIKKNERWDISKNGDGSVIARWTLENRTITISGNGEMKDWTYNLNEDWHSCKYKGIIEIVKINDGVTNIGNETFEECSSLTSIAIPNSATSIGEYAFGECRSLTNIEIPNSVTKIGYSTFYNCSSLENIYVEENNSKYISMEGVLYNKDKTDLICYPEGKKDTNFIVPDSVATIEDNAFSGCSSLTSIEIPNSVATIEDNAFSGCSSLTSIEIPNSVTSIGSSAFRGCSSLTNIEIPNGITSIEYNTFSGCSSLTNIKIPNSVTSIGRHAFIGCSSLTNIEIPNSVTSIESYAFYRCSRLTSIRIPNSATSIGEYAFGGCSSLTNITIPDSVTSIEGYAFEGCSSLTNIEIPNSVTSIGYFAFFDCSNLLRIEIPNGVMNIEQYAFSECSSLTNITIPDSVTSIKTAAFHNCKGPIICKRNTEAHRYAEGEKIGYIIDKKMPKVTYTPSKFEKAQKQAVVKIDVTDITGVEEDNIKYLWSTKEEVSIEEVNNTLTNGQEISSPTGKNATYYIYVYAKDKFGNEGIAKSSAIKLDNTAPTIELTENKYYQKPNIQDENPGTVVLTKDGNKVETYKYGETIFGEGTYELTATDEAGNSTTKEFILQKIPTGEEGLNYEITPTELTIQDVTFNVSKKDVTNTELDIELSTDGENYEVGNTKTITENGKVYARLGKEGAYGEALEIEITNIDKKAPVIEGVQDKKSYSRKAAPRAVDENLESVKLEKDGQEVEGYVNGTEIKELGTYKITATDKVGNKTEVEFYIKDIPSTEEVIEYRVTPEELTNQDVKVSVTKKENEEYQDLIVQMSTDGKNYEATTEKIITGNATVYIRIVKEEEGNTIEGEAIEVEIKNIDKTAPETQVEYSNKELTNQNVTVTVTANEEVRSVVGWTLSNDKKTISKTYQSNTEERIELKDVAGNTVYKNIYIKNIDKTSPVITGVENGKTYKGSVTAIVTDDNPGTLVLEKDGTRVEGYTNGKEIIEEGTYKLTAKDKAGNTTIVNFTIKYMKGDLNRNNQIDIGDVLLLLRHIAQANSEIVLQKHPQWKLSNKDVIVGDINKNGKIDVGDSLKLQRYMAAKASKNVAEKHPDWLNLN